MTTELETSPTPTPAEHGPSAAILVATDGTSQSDGGVATGCAMAAQLGAPMRIVAVERPLRLSVPDTPELIDPRIKVKLTADLMNMVRAECDRVAAATSNAALPVPEILTGEPPRVLGQTAAREGAQLVVTGLGAHDLMDRIFGDETALKLARVSRVPVLAVPERCLTVPRRAVAGIDFSEASIHAAQTALGLLPPGGALDLVHIVSRERQLLEPWLSERAYDRLVRNNFRRVRARLGEREGIAITDAVRIGDPARGLIAYADEVAADLIVTGSHGHGFVTRVVLGSITTKVLRTATCAVLVVPPSERIVPQDGGGRKLTLHVDPSRWAELLDDFTRANRGRRTQLEVDDPEIGAQAQEEDYPLIGVTYDRHDGRVEIMVGRTGPGEPHFSRSIGEVSSIDVLSDTNGRDLVLRLRHGRGQTILSLAP